MLKEKLLVDELQERMIPCEVQRDQMRHKLTVVGDTGPRLSWDIVQRDITELLQSDELAARIGLGGQALQLIYLRDRLF